MDHEGMEELHSFLLEVIGESLEFETLPNSMDDICPPPEANEPQPHPPKARLELPNTQICSKGQDVELTLVDGQGEETVFMIEFQRLMDIVALITPTPRPALIGSGFLPHPEQLQIRGQDNNVSLPPLLSPTCSTSSSCSWDDGQVSLPDTGTSWTLSDPSRTAIPVTDQETKKIFICNFCQKRFLTPSKLERHLVVHTRDKPFSCRCGNTFTTKRLLTIHKRQHGHTPVPEGRPTSMVPTTHVTNPTKRAHDKECPFCERTFDRKSYLNDHISCVHLGIRYPCRQPNCDKKYSWKRDLIKHEEEMHLKMCPTP